jgi:lysophospholipase L1-like esterase
MPSLQRYLILAAFWMMLPSSDSTAAPPPETPTLAGVVAMLEAGEPVRIVCFGDSITGVYYHTGSRRAWCDMLGIALRNAYPRAKIDMINAGVSGNTTVVGLQRMQRDVVARNPHLVVVAFGMNDVRGITLDEYQRNLETIVNRCHAAGAAVILCTPNSVYANPDRPNAKLKELAARVHIVAEQWQLPVVDVFREWQEIRQRNETEWMLLMSHTIHPNMNGHRRFAELIAGRITGTNVKLGPIEPPADGLQNTVRRLRAKQPLRLIAMPPYDQIMPAALRAHFPEAQIEVTTWPVESKTVAALSEWARPIRENPPHLIVIAVPATADDKSTAAYIDHYNWVLNWSLHFSDRPWDVVPVLPRVTGSVAASDQRRQELARRIIVGKDIEFVDRDDGNDRPAAELVQAWVTERVRREP